MKGTTKTKSPTGYSDLCNQISEIHDKLKAELPSHQHFYNLLEAIDGVILEPSKPPERLREFLPSDKAVELFIELMEVRLKRHQLVTSNLYV